MRSYYRVTQLETIMTAYRRLTHQNFVNSCHLLAHLTEQSLADQRRLIIKQQYLTNYKLNTTKQVITAEIAEITTLNNHD